MEPTIKSNVESSKKNVRLSVQLNKAISKARKGKNIGEAIVSITKAIKGAVAAYKGTSKGALKANKDAKYDTVEGSMPMSVLDEESLLVIIGREHRKCVVNCSAVDENYSLNAELAREISTNSTLLGATYWLSNVNSEGNTLL